MDMVRRNAKRLWAVLLAGVLLLGLLSGCSVELGDVDDVLGSEGSSSSDYVSEVFGKSLEVDDIIDYWNADAAAFKRLSSIYYLY